MNRLIVSIACLLLADAGFAVDEPPTNVAAAEQDAPIVADVYVPRSENRQKIVCRMEAQFGTRIKQKRCYTRYQRGAGEQWAQEGLVDLMDQMELARMREIQAYYENRRQQEEMQIMMLRAQCRAAGTC